MVCGMLSYCTLSLSRQVVVSAVHILWANMALPVTGGDLDVGVVRSNCDWRI